MWSMRIILIGALVTVATGFSHVASAQPVVWTGPEISFTKADGTDETDPANQDAITANVILTRGNRAGIYNIAQEDSFDRGNDVTSPVDTEWAFPANNPNETIEATNWSNLQFDPWVTAFGGLGMPGPPSTVDQPAVLHLISDDIYLDIMFTQWSQRNGGFAYNRSTAGVIPEPTAVVLVTLGGVQMLLTRRRRVV